MRRRDGERIGEVVEAAIGGFIARQKRPHVEIEREEIADRVVVLHSIQPVYGADSPWMWMGDRGGIESVFERSGDGVIGGRIGPRSSWRGHGAGAKFADHALPDLGIRACLRDVQRVKRKTRGTKSL